MNRTLPETTTIRRRTWIHAVVWLTLTGLFIVGHGCHGDKDTELSLALRSQRERTTNQTNNTNEIKGNP